MISNNDSFNQQIFYGAIRMKKLLLVEDDKVFGEALQEGLTHCNYHTTWLKYDDATQEALKGHDFDVILLDITLPSAGFTWVQSLRDDHDLTPVIILTGEAYEAIKQSCRKVAVNDIIEKPFELDKLCDHIERLLLPKAN